MNVPLMCQRPDDSHCATRFQHERQTLRWEGCFRAAALGLPFAGVLSNAGGVLETAESGVVTKLAIVTMTMISATVKRLSGASPVSRFAGVVGRGVGQLASLFRRETLVLLGVSVVAGQGFEPQLPDPES